MIQRVLATTLSLALLLVTYAPSIALAAAPANDDVANATELPTSQFTDSLSVADATVEPFEPGFCYGAQNTVWYRFHGGESGYFLTLDTIGSDYDANINVWTPGETPQSFFTHSCVPGSGGTIFIQPGETVLIQVTGGPANTTTTGTGTTTTTGTTGTTSTGTATTGTTGTTTTGGDTTTGTTTGGTASTGTTTTGGTTTGGAVEATTIAGTNLVFNANPLPYAPIDMALTVAGGSVGRPGWEAVITGTVSCSRPGPLNVSVSLTQVFARRFVATGSGGSETVDCGPTPQTWSAVVPANQPILFGPGKADVYAQTSMCDMQGCGFVELWETVVIKGSK